MKLTWVSGNEKPQQVQYGNGKSQTSTVTTFSQDDMQSEFSSFYFSINYFPRRNAQSHKYIHEVAEVEVEVKVNEPICSFSHYPF